MSIIIIAHNNAPAVSSSISHCQHQQSSVEWSNLVRNSNELDNVNVQWADSNYYDANSSVRERNTKELDLPSHCSIKLASFCQQGETTIIFLLN
jgi:predicted HTH transcriptional regulator